MSDGTFRRVIAAHLALAERNKRLERRMPLDRYREHYGPLRDDPEPEPGVSSLEAAETGASSPLRRDPESWRDPDSWWDASEERAAPSFDWGEG